MTNLENLRQEKLTIDLVWANRFGLLILIPIVLVFGLPYFFLWSEQFSKVGIKAQLHSISDVTGINSGLSVFLAMILGIVIHELVHGITWSFFTKKGFRSISFGVLWKMLTPYCHCNETLKVRDYILGAIMPSIIVGIIPAIVAIAIGNLPLLAFGMFFTMAAAGDFLIIHLIWKERWEDLVLDHPSEAGCYIYRTN